MNTINLYGDPLLGNSANGQQAIEAQKQYLAQLEAMQKQAVNQMNSPSKHPLWDKIDEEISTLTDLQKNTLFNSQEYIDANNGVQTVLQNTLLAAMKPQVENSEAGKEALQRQYEVVKKLKKSVVEQTNQEMEELRQWKEFSRKNPNATYQDFLSTTNK